MAGWRMLSAGLFSALIRALLLVGVAQITRARAAASRIPCSESSRQTSSAADASACFSLSGIFWKANQLAASRRRATSGDFKPPSASISSGLSLLPIIFSSRTTLSRNILLSSLRCFFSSISAAGPMATSARSAESRTGGSASLATMGAAALVLDLAQRFHREPAHGLHGGVAELDIHQLDQAGHADLVTPDAQGPAGRFTGLGVGVVEQVYQHQGRFGAHVGNGLLKLGQEVDGRPTPALFGVLGVLEALLHNEINGGGEPLQYLPGALAGAVVRHVEVGQDGGLGHRAHVGEGLLG